MSHEAVGFDYHAHNHSEFVPCTKMCSFQAHPPVDLPMPVRIKTRAEQKEKYADPDKGIPYRKLKQRARYVLRSLSTAQRLAVIMRLIEVAPQAAAAAICDEYELAEGCRSRSSEDAKLAATEDGTG